MDIALKEAETRSASGGDGTRAFGGSALSSMTGLLGQVPGAGDLVKQAQDLQAHSDAQRLAVASGEAPGVDTRADSQPTTVAGGPAQNIPGTSIDPIKTAKQIYPILEFRDKVAKALSVTIEKIPGLEALVEKITETLTLFVLSLLAPFIRPIINAVSKQLKAGSGGVIDASGRSQYEPWTDPYCLDPTHSLLSKDHFSNVLNEPAGQVASTILTYVAPRIVYAWEHPDVPVEQVLNDVVRVFHHPAIRDSQCEIHRNMYNTVERWARSRPDGGSGLNHLLGSDSVRNGKNHTVDASHQSHSHGGLPSRIPGMPSSFSNMMPSGVSNMLGSVSHSKVGGSLWNQVGRFREIDESEVGQAGSVGNNPDTFSGAQRPQPHQETYSQNPYPQGGPPEGQWQQPYQGQDPPGGQYYPQGGPPPPGGASYGYDPNAPPSQQYGYQGPPPTNYYGAPPPPQY